MKPYARTFYESRSWKDCRETYLIKQQYICERCGEIAKVVHHKKYITQDNINNLDITLSFDNLEALCQDCHNKEHHENKNKKDLHYKFDSDGKLFPIPP